MNGPTQKQAFQIGSLLEVDNLKVTKPYIVWIDNYIYGLLSVIVTRDAMQEGNFKDFRLKLIQTRHAVRYELYLPFL